MLTLIAPIWAWGAGAIALAGAAALWRGRKNRVPVSSTKLWAGISKEAAGAKKRIADPLWILLWLGAVFAGIAAARPAWQSGDDSPAMKLEVEARAIPGATEAELFVRSQGEGVPDAMEIVANEKRQRVALDSTKLRTGVITKIPPAAHLAVDFFVAGKKVTTRELNMETRRPLNVHAIGRVPEVLRRVFNVMNSGEDSREDAVHVLLLASYAADMPEYIDPPRDAIVVFNGDFILPENRKGSSIKIFDPPAKIKPEVASALTMDDGKPIEFGGTVASMQILKPAAGREIVLTAGGLPLVMVERKDERNVTYVYLATNLSPSSTDWPLDVSFPIFFSKIVETVRPASGDGGAIQWRTSEIGENTPAKRMTALAPWLVTAAIALIAAASAGLIRRGMRLK